jgi:probable HAF family extracellular repeat protein
MAPIALVMLLHVICFSKASVAVGKQETPVATRPPKYRIMELLPLVAEASYEVRDISSSGTAVGVSWAKTAPMVLSSRTPLIKYVTWKEGTQMPEEVVAVRWPNPPQKTTGAKTPLDSRPTVVVSIKNTEPNINKRTASSPRKNVAILLDRRRGHLIQVNVTDYVDMAAIGGVDNSSAVYPMAAASNFSTTGEVKSTTVVGLIGTWATDGLGRSRMRAFACGIDGVLRYLPSPTQFSQAFAVSPSGQVVGKVAVLPPGKVTKYSKKALSYVACVWHPQLNKPGWQAPVILGTPGGQSEAVAINATGQIVGYAHSGSGGAYLWERHGEQWLETNLGTLISAPSGTNAADSVNFSCATDINDRGQIVGYSTAKPGAGRQHACLWARDASGKYLPHDLNDQITESGWELIRATKIIITVKSSRSASKKEENAPCY